MKGFIAVAAIAIAAVAGIPAAAQELPGRLSAIPYPLTLSNTAVSADVAPDSLRLVSPKGSDLYSPAKGPPVDTAPRVTFTPAGDFILSARVSRPHAADFEGAALVVHAGAGRWAKLLFERLNEGANAITSSVADPVGDGSYHIRVAPDVPAMWLKVVRAGGSVLLYTSEDGKRWQILRDFPLAEDLPVSVGFASQSPYGQQYEAVFTDIRFEPRRYQDYWQGE